MRKSWLLCVFLGALAWGQAGSMTPPERADEGPNTAAKPAAAPVAEVAESAAVLTIKGVCAATPRATAAAAPAAGKTASAPKKPADCQTVITRAQFDKLAKSLQQGAVPLNPQQKRQLASQLPSAVALSEAAKKKGLDKSDSYLETLKFVKMRILAQKLTEAVRAEADQVPATQIAAYYKANPEAFEQLSVDRLFIPINKQVDDKDEGKEPEKLTEEQEKAKEAADRAAQEKGQQELSSLADSMRQRVVAGEDIGKLQKEAFEVSGTKVDNPTVNLPTVRRTGLPPGHAAVFELKVGDVSAVITDNGGHYVYKVVSKVVLPLDDKTTMEIRNKLKGERFKEMMDKYTNSYQTVTNEAYFGPATPSGPMPRMRPQLPVTPRAQPQGAAKPDQSPATQPPAAAPPAKPN